MYKFDNQCNVAPSVAWLSVVAPNKNFSVECDWKMFLGSLQSNINIVLYIIIGPSFPNNRKRNEIFELI